VLGSGPMQTGAVIRVYRRLGNDQFQGGASPLGLSNPVKNTYRARLLVRAECSVANFSPPRCLGVSLKVLVVRSLLIELVCSTNDC